MAVAIPLGCNNMEFLVIGLILGLVLGAAVVMYLYSDQKDAKKMTAEAELGQ